MRILLLGVFLLLAGASLTAQTYYVAIVKGEVYYNDQPLKPRTKIELQGNLRFTTKDDYIKVSGPGGIHTIRPEAKSDGGYEFLRAVTQELFPAAKPKGSYVLSAWINFGDGISLYDGSHHNPDYFLEGERRSIRQYLKRKDYDWLYWVFNTRDGAVRWKPALVIDDAVVLSTAPFRSASGESITDGSAYLMIVRDLDVLERATRKHSIETLYWNTNIELRSDDWAAQYIPADQISPAAKRYFPTIASLVQLIEPEKVVPSAEIFATMQQLMLEYGETDIETFINRRGFENVDGFGELLIEQYGAMDLGSVTDAYWYYLKQRVSEDPRLQPLLDGYTPQTGPTDSSSRKWERKQRRAFYRQ